MPPDWIIVIGGSAGAFAPLREILRDLGDAPTAAVLVVMHTTAAGDGRLGRLIERLSPMPVVVPSPIAPLEGGRVYAAAPDRHLRIDGDRVRLTREPREHHTRPAIDVLLRSAARAGGDRTIAVILSGYGGDGASGSVAVRSRNGIVIVQEPADAEVDGMPRRAVSTGHVDRVLPAREIGRTLRALVREPRRTSLSKGEHREEEQAAMSGSEGIRKQIGHDISAQERNERGELLTPVTCPDCGGTLWQDEHGAFVDFTCHIGHRFTTDTLLVEKTEQLEAALLHAVRLLKEKAMLLRQTATRAQSNGNTTAAERLTDEANLAGKYAHLIERELLEAEPSAMSSAGVDDDVTRVEGRDS